MEPKPDLVNPQERGRSPHAFPTAWLVRLKTHIKRFAIQRVTYYKPSAIGHNLFISITFQSWRLEEMYRYISKDIRMNRISDL